MLKIFLFSSLKIEILKDILKHDWEKKQEILVLGLLVNSPFCQPTQNCYQSDVKT
jgi:hypothetical protein